MTERIDVKTKAEAEKAIKAGKAINTIAGVFALTLTDVNVSIWVSGDAAPRIVTWGTSAPRCNPDAPLRGELRFVKADYFLILATAHREVPSLIATLRAGKVDGSTYSGSCACLVGSLEKAGAKGLPHEAQSPAEQWFVPIRPGVKPGDEGEGGYRATMALEWALEYCAATGLEVPVEVSPNV